MGIGQIIMGMFFRTSSNEDDVYSCSPKIGMSRGSEQVYSVSHGPLGMSRGRTKEAPPPAPMDNSPKPYRFKILDSETFGNYRILKIKYLDPHFLEGYYSPIARFEPTKKGWKMAVKFVRAMSGL